MPKKGTQNGTQKGTQKRVDRVYIGCRVGNLTVFASQPSQSSCRVGNLTAFLADQVSLVDRAATKNAVARQPYNWWNFLFKLSSRQIKMHRQPNAVERQDQKNLSWRYRFPKTGSNPGVGNSFGFAGHIRGK